MPVKVHGRKTCFIVTDIGATERDISNYCTNVDMPTQIDTAETTGFGDQDKTFLAGLRGHTIRVQGHWSKDANMVDVILSGLAGQGAAGTTVTTFKYGPGGSASGDVRYSGSCILTNFGRTSPIGGVVSFSADFQISGSVLRDTF